MSTKEGDIENAFKSSKNVKPSALDAEEAKFNRESTRLSLMFFGTAIGAGLLYLPVQAGAAGLLLSLIGMLVMYPITYFCQKYFISLMTNATNSNSIADTIGEFLGTGAKNFFNIVWICMLLAGLISYGTGLVANLSELLTEYNIISFKLTGNVFFVILIMGSLTTFALFSDKLIIKFIEKATIVLISVIGLIAVLFIPYWDISNLFAYDYNPYTIAKSSFLMAPVLLFAVIYYCAQPSAVAYAKKEYKDKTVKELEPMLQKSTLKASVLLSVFTAIFVFSLGISLSPESLQYAAANNLSALAVISHNHADGLYMNFLVFLGYAMTIIALVTTYYGVQFGLVEGVVSRLNFMDATEKFKRNMTIIAVNVFYTIVIIFNFSVLKTLGLIVIPSIALLVFVFPTIIIFKTPKLKKYRTAICVIVGIAGIFNIFSYMIGLIL